MISLTTNRGADYLVIVVSVEGFVEGCILNAVHHVSVFGIHRTSSLLSRSVRHHRAAFFVVRFTLPTMIVYLCTGIIASVNNAKLPTVYWCLLYSFTGTFLRMYAKSPPRRVEPLAGLCAALTVVIYRHGKRIYSVIHRFHPNKMRSLYACGGLRRMTINRGRILGEMRIDRTFYSMI